MKKFLTKFKTWCKDKGTRMGMALSAASVALCGAASAAEEGAGATLDTTAITGAMTTGLNNVVTQAISLLSVILPIAIAFFGTKWLCVKGMAWFKSMAK